MDQKLIDALNDISEIMKENTEAYDKESEEYWNSLSKEDQLKAFYSVVKRIYKGEIEDRGSYRWILYQVFGFGPEAYTIGMECGFLCLHNCIDVGDKKLLDFEEEV